MDDDEDDDIPKKRAAQLPLPETGVLWHMAQSEKHRHLLKHPVITSFLWLKWQRIRQVTDTVVCGSYSVGKRVTIIQAWQFTVTPFGPAKTVTGLYKVQGSIREGLS